MTLEPDDNRNISKEKETEIAEKEVFMPIIDETNFKIIHPTSRKPVIKWQSVNKKIPQIKRTAFEK